MKKNSLLITSLILLFAFVLLIFVDGKVNKSDEKVNSPVDTNEVEVSSFVLEDGSTFNVPGFLDITPGSTVKLETTIDYCFKDNTGPSFIMQANHYFLTVILDGKTLYQVPVEEHSLGNYFTRIPFPDKVENGHLELIIKTPRIGISHIDITKPIIAKEGSFARSNLFNDIPSLALTTIILAFGIVSSLLVLFTRHKDMLISVLPKGIFAIVCAIYFYCETFTIVYLMPNARVTYLCDMMSFMFIGPFLLLSVLSNAKRSDKNILNLVIAAGIINIVIQGVIGGLNMMTFRKMIPLTHLTQILAILAICFITLRSIKNHNFKEEVYNLDLIFICAIGGILDIVFFYLEIGSPNVFFFKIALLIYFARNLYHMIQTIIKKSNTVLKEDFYKTIAMHDSLTQCYSRMAYDLERTTWDKSNKAIIFSADVNNLKEANDLHGHVVGDELLVTVANILKEAFLNVGDVYRIGGDEFIICAFNLTSVQAQVFVDKLRLLEEDVNGREVLPVKVSFAVGFASTSETSGNINACIKLADERMYINKSEIKGTKPDLTSNLGKLA